MYECGEKNEAKGMGWKRKIYKSEHGADDLNEVKGEDIDLNGF